MSIHEQDDVVRRSREFLLSVPGLRLAIVYGSAVSGRMRPNSDVDIAVLLDQPLSAERKVNIAIGLEQRLSRRVDLTDLMSLSGTILKQILCKGQVLVKADTASIAELTRKMIYNQADLMPLVRRTLEERQMRFVYG